MNVLHTKKLDTFSFHRPCFENLLSCNTQENRITLAEKSKSTMRGSIVDTGYTDKQWTEEWEKLKQNGIYEVNFGDFFLYGMYRITMVNSEIFNCRYNVCIEKKCCDLSSWK